jgi:hypothetical protein
MKTAPSHHATSGAGGRPGQPLEVEPRVSLGAAAALYFGLALLYFLPALLPGRHLYGTDYLVGSYFVHEFFSERFGAGEIPKWLPYIYGGAPVFANPGSAFYPFRLLADLLLPVSKLFAALFVIQFGLAGLGMHLLARDLGTRRWVTLVAGLAFEFTGITASWVLAGHEGRIIVATFAPLVFFFFHRGIRTGALAPFAGAAAAIGFALLTFQIQNSYYLLVGALIWSLFLLWHFGLFREPRRLAKVVALGVGAVAFAFTLAAVNFLPFLDYVDASPRGGPGRGYEYSVSYSMPAAEVLAVAVPEHAGVLDTYRGTNPFKLHTEYVGATVLALVALGFAYARRSRYWWFFFGLGLFFLTIALGGETPLYRVYYELLPGAKKFRAPSISFFMVSLSLVAMAAITLESLAARAGERRVAGAVRVAREPKEVPGPWRWILAGVVAFAVVAGALATGAPVPQGVAPVGPAAWRFALFAAAVAAILWFWLKGSLGVRSSFLLLAAVTVVDLWIVDKRFLETVPPPDEMFAADDVADFLRVRPGRDRVWVLPFPPGGVYRGQPGNYLMHFDVDQAGGEHGNQLQRWNEYIGAGEEVYVDWHNFLNHPVFLNAANVRYIVSGVEFQDPRLREVHRGTALVYENLGALPRAWLVPEVVTTDQPDGALEILKRAGFDPRQTAVVNVEAPLRLPDGLLQGSTQVTEYTPDRVVIRTRQNREALLVLADNFYEGWVARIDGREAPILRTNHTFRGIVVGPGEHEVVFTFEPGNLYRGFWVYAGGLALLTLYGVFLLVRAVRRKDAPAAE